MSTVTRFFSAPAPHSAAGPAGARRALLMLRTVFTVAPIAFGLDKFFNVPTDWEKYMAPWINDLAPGSAHQAMLAVGVVEIFAGVLVAVRPSIGAYVVAAWLLGIIVNLVSLGGYYDIALRDFGLLVGALALALLAANAGTASARTAAGRTAAGRTAAGPMASVSDHGRNGGAR